MSLYRVTFLTQAVIVVEADSIEDARARKYNEFIDDETDVHQEPINVEVELLETTE